MSGIDSFTVAVRVKPNLSKSDENNEIYDALKVINQKQVGVLLLVVSLNDFYIINFSSL